jgi:putative transposase
MVESLKRAIILQTEPTKSKAKALMRFNIEALDLANWLLKKRKSKHLMELYKATFKSCKRNTSFQAQTICDIMRTVVKSKGEAVTNIVVKFNVPRNSKTFITKTKNFVEIRPYPRKRIVVPIRHNRNFQRYSSLLNAGWICKTYGLLHNGQIIAYLSKDKEIAEKPNVLGIDINAKHFAVSVVSPNGKILYQTYFGKHIYARRKQIMERRDYLKSIGAKKPLDRLKRTERNFVKTNLAQMTKEIINIANRFNAEIAIEDLTGFKNTGKGKRFNKKVMRIAFAKFRGILESRCFDNNIPLRIIDKWHTSKWCSHCGAVGKGHSTVNYSLFKCQECGQIVNSDRKASLAVAVKSLLVRNSQTLNQSDSFQLTRRRVPVNGLIRQNDFGLLNCVFHANHLTESHQF